MKGRRMLPLGNKADLAVVFYTKARLAVMVGVFISPGVKANLAAETVARMELVVSLGFKSKTGQLSGVNIVWKWVKLKSQRSKKIAKWGSEEFQGRFNNISSIR
ncbi:hypothetical protein FQA39_LY07114 [Lamprigera yunnana]|nr:hypothetical protein FQA39_LY07114 [Lamprigera yunnana]